MAGGSTNLTWNLIADSNQYVSGFRKAQAATDNLNKSSKKAQRQHELMSRAAGVVGVAVAVAFGKKIVDAASDLNETMSKTSVVFGDSSKEIVDWSETAAKSMGLSQQKAAEAAATFGNLFVSMNLGQKPAADMSKNLVQLASDLASFNNVDPTEALDALRSGLVGETEPLRRFGVNLNDADLRQKALAMGLVETTKSVLPPAIKSQAAYALILEQTKTAQGDFARTSTGLANSQRILTAEWEDAQAKLGQSLLPVVTKATTALSDLLEVVNGLPQGTRDAGLAVAALGAAAVVAAPKVMALRTQLNLMGTSLTSVLGKAGAAGAAIASVYALGEASAWLSDRLGQGEQSLDEWSRSFKDGLDAQELQRISSAMEGFAGTSANLSGAIAAFSRGDVAGGLGAIKNGTEEVENFDAAMAQAASSGNTKFVQATIAALGLSAEDAANKLPQTTAALQSFGEKSNWAAKQTLKVATEASEAAKEVQKFASVLNALNEPARSATEAQIAMINAQKELGKELATGSTSFDIHTKAGQENRLKLIEATSAVDSLAAALEAKGVSEDKVRLVTIKHKNAIVDNLVKSGLARTKAEALVNQYLKIPPAADAASTSVDGLTDALNKMPTSKVVTVSLRTKGQRILDDTEHRAMGGPVRASRTYLVGERGPELFTPSTSGHIVPNHKLPTTGTAGSASAVALSLSGTAPIQINLDGEPVWKSLLHLKKAKGGASLGLS